MLLIKNLQSKHLLHTQIFIWIFYFVGIAGIAWPKSQDFFIGLTPLALLISSFTLIIFHKSYFNLKIAILFISIFLLGFFIEVVGVNTGLIFGAYSYGKTLGFKIIHTPILIGLNWLLLVYTIAAKIENLKFNLFSKALISSLYMVLIDVLIEQVAPKIDMWTWAQNEVPWQNYFAWFLISFTFHAIIQFSKIKINNPIAKTIYDSQFIFFLFLTIILA